VNSFAGNCFLLQRPPVILFAYRLN
jgi:hypothetical protein